MHNQRTVTLFCLDYIAVNTTSLARPTTTPNLRIYYNAMAALVIFGLLRRPPVTSTKMIRGRQQWT
eukprot:4966600-Heterocapsa_arctica.AAC.1